MPVNTIYSILVKKENAHDDPIYCCTWNKVNLCAGDGDVPDSIKEFIVTGGLDCSVRVWTVQNDKLLSIHALDSHRMAVVSVAVSPTAPIIASSSLDSTIIFWNLPTGKILAQLPTPTGASDVWQMAFSGDGKYLCTGGHTGKVHIYVIRTGNLDKVLDTRGKFILSVAWSGNSKYIATGAEDGVLCILDVTQRKVVHTVEAHTKPIRKLAFSPCNKRLATVSNDGYVKLYDVASAGLQYSLNLKCWAVAICFSGDGTRIAVGAADGTVRVLLTEGLIVLNTFQEHTDTVWGVNFNFDNNRLVSVSKDNSLNIYECPPLPPKTEKKEATLIK